MKRYRIDEANALLPHLAPLLVELQGKWDEAQEIRAKIDQAAERNGGSEKRETWARKLARVDEILARIEGWEIILRDVDEGLVDFPATIDGGDAFLCWKLGEPAVTHWHRPDTGFAGRQPL